jgi:hypothetical protein
MAVESGLRKVRLFTVAQDDIRSISNGFDASGCPDVQNRRCCPDCARGD